MIGCGGMARAHFRNMLKQTATTQVSVMCEPSEAQYAASAKMFEDAGLPVPPNQPDLGRLLKDCAGELDAAFIITPHANHHDQTKACLEAGLDVLLEKPMVLNAAEARSLIETRNRTGKLLVVAFPGSLSPQIRAASRLRPCGRTGDRPPTAPGASNRQSRAAASSSTPARTCSTPVPTWRAKTLLRSLPGWTTTAGPWTPWAW
jgi:predicted dehydrogenase